MCVSHVVKGKRDGPHIVFPLYRPHVERTSGANESPKRDPDIAVR